MYHYSGYDFGYLLKLITGTNLPPTEQEFFELMHVYFSNIYDVKYLMKSCKNLKGGLQEVSEQLEVCMSQINVPPLIYKLMLFCEAKIIIGRNTDDSWKCRN